MTRRYLLDTNHLSAAVNLRSSLRVRLRDAYRDGHVLGTCVLTLAELEVGFLQTPDPDRNRQALIQVRRHVRLWPLDESLARRYGEVAAELRRIGRALSQVDIVLAALCRQMGLTLLTTDRDFEALPDIRTENWVSNPAQPTT